jgi:hypothetical protein
MAKKVNTFEGGSDGTVITVGNSGGASGNAFNVVSTDGGVTSPTFESDHALNTLCCHIVGASSSDFVYVRWNSLGDLKDSYGQAYVYFTANPATNIVLSYLTDSSGNPVGRVRIDTTGLVKAVDAANSIAATTTVPINLNNWTRLEWRYRVTPNLLTIRIATRPNDFHIEEITGVMDTGNALDQERMGQNIPAGACDFYMDNLVSGGTGWEFSLSSILMSNRIGPR